MAIKKKNADTLELGSLLEGVKKFAEDKRVTPFVQELLEFEKQNSYTYKPEIRALLDKYANGES